jgi:hypothetical protein
MYKLAVTLLTAIVGFSCMAEQRHVTAYAYHLKPPFITNLSAEQGLYYDLSRFLSFTPSLCQESALTGFWLTIS